MNNIINYNKIINIVIHNLSMYTRIVSSEFELWMYIPFLKKKVFVCILNIFI